MTKTAKMLSVVLIAITLAGVGYFFIINKPEPEVLPPVNEAPKVEEVDTSDWQTYRNETLGFEIKMPKEWIKRYERLGNQPNLEDEFWREQVGEVSFISSYEKGFPKFSVRVKDTDLTMDGFGFAAASSTEINGLPVKFYKSSQKNLGKVAFGEQLLIRSGMRHYLLDFDTWFDTQDNVNNNYSNLESNIE